jgi:hypothetical protein
MTQVQTRSTGSFGSSPEAATRALLDTVSRYTNRLEDGDRPGHKIISAGLAPSGGERSALEDRKAHLLECLQPASGPEAQILMARVIGSLFAAFPSYGAGEEQAKLAVGMICRALDDVPVWAVQRAAANFLKGQTKTPWNPDRAPTPPQIRSEAKLIVLDVETELHRLNQVLDAELVDNDTTEDERAAALAHWAEIRAGIASTNVLAERTDDEVQRERDAMLRANAVCKAKAGPLSSELEARRAKREGEQAKEDAA